jgi:hypothetical protein
MAGPPTFATPPGFLGIVRADQGAEFVVAGVPLDIGTTNRAGTRDGPAAIRRASRMLVDGVHPAHWVDPRDLDIADIGDFAIALGDIPGSLALIERQAATCRHLSRWAASMASPWRCCAPCRGASAGRSGCCIAMPMSIPGPTTSARPSPTARPSIMRSGRGWSIPGG